MNPLLRLIKTYHNNQKRSKLRTKVTKQKHYETEAQVAKLVMMFTIIRDGKTAVEIEADRDKEITIGNIIPEINGVVTDLIGLEMIVIIQHRVTAVMVIHTIEAVIVPDFTGDY